MKPALRFALLLLSATVFPTLSVAQRRVSAPPPAGPIGRTAPLPPAEPRIEPTFDRTDRWRRFDRLWGYPLVLDAMTTPAPTPVPYPVPVYYPVPVSTASARRVRERPAPPPYDPTKSRMTIVGGGADGGGGVMRIERFAPDSVRLTWLVPPRPVRSAFLFLADDAQARLRSLSVTADNPRASFGLTKLPRSAAYAGLTIEFADGAQRTTLVPLTTSSH